MKQLFDKYYLDTDSLNYIIMESHVTKKGEKTFKTSSNAFHGTLASVIKSLKERVVRENITSKNADEIIRQLVDINNLIVDNDIMSVKKESKR